MTYHFVLKYPFLFSLITFIIGLLIGLTINKYSLYENYDNVNTGGQSFYNWMGTEDISNVDDITIYQQYPKGNYKKCYAEDLDLVEKAKICRNCDITLNKDIDQYIKKSSLPPFPNMNNYVKKSELEIPYTNNPFQQNFNSENYIPDGYIQKTIKIEESFRNPTNSTSI